MSFLELRAWKTASFYQNLSLNANTPTLGTEETKTPTELFVVIDGMTDTLEHFGKKSNKIKTAPTESANWKPA